MGIRSFSRQPVPVPHHPCGEEFLLSNLNQSYFDLKLLALSLQSLTESLLSSPVGPLWALEDHYKVSFNSSLLQAEKPQLLQPVCIGEVLQPTDHFCGHPGNSCPYAGDPRADLAP